MSESIIPKIGTVKQFFFGAAVVAAGMIIAALVTVPVVNGINKIMSKPAGEPAKA